MTGLIVDHLWQSTLVAALVGLLTLVLRRNRAQTRYWLWLAASAKFFVPFAALVALASQFNWLSPVAIPRMDVAFVIDTPGAPFYRPGFRIAMPASQSALPAVSSTVISGAALSLWLLGTGLIILTWAVRWRRVAATVRGAVPLEDGRVLDTLRRVEAFGGHTKAIPLVASHTSLEPAVFGILRPVLLWPTHLEEHLSNEQIEAILAHELVHVRHRDNLAAAVHMVVQALFWFNPLVWWIGKRLIDERERACDETVIRWGSDRQVYAESILKTCQFSMQSPLVCMAGVTGSDLKARIESIMRSQGGEQLNLSKKALLAIVSIATIAVPVALGALTSPRGQAQSEGATRHAFEVASIRPNQSGDEKVTMQIQPGGRMNIRNATIRLMIRNAYRLQDFQIVGGPSWINNDRFDVTAKAEGNPTQAELSLMLQTLLAERFNMTVHTELREQPTYALVLARNDRELGSEIRKAEFNCVALRSGPPPEPGRNAPCNFRVGPGSMVAQGQSMAAFAASLSNVVSRVVVNKTDLEGEFDFKLEWTPDRLSQRPPGAPEPPLIDPNGPSIFTALQEQLSLKLDAQRGPVEVLVIDGVGRPTPD